MTDVGCNSLAGLIHTVLIKGRGCILESILTLLFREMIARRSREDDRFGWLVVMGLFTFADQKITKHE